MRRWLQALIARVDAPAGRGAWLPVLFFTVIIATLRTAAHADDADLPCGTPPDRDVTEDVHDHGAYAGKFYFQDREVARNLVAVCEELKRLSKQKAPDLDVLGEINSDLKEIAHRIGPPTVTPPPPPPPPPVTSGPQYTLNVHDMLDVDEVLLKKILDKLQPSVTVVMPDKDGGDKDKQVKRQIDPLIPIARYFPDAGKIEFLVATVPDPRVPRLRRKYDETIVAITDGMLKSGFVIDRYGFPWASTLDGEIKGEEEKKVGENGSDGKAPDPAALADDGRFGVLIFRQDKFRTDSKPVAENDSGSLPWRAEVRAVYLVPETGSYGVAINSFQCAVRRIFTQVPTTDPKVQDAQREALRTCIAQADSSELEGDQLYLSTARGSDHAEGEPLPNNGAAPGKDAAQDAAAAEKRRKIDSVYFMQTAAPPPQKAADGDAVKKQDDIQDKPQARSPPAMSFASLPLCNDKGQKRLVVFGPAFSGSIDSLAVAAKSIENIRDGTDLCVVGTATTVASNTQINHRPDLRRWFFFETLAIGDEQKLDELDLLRQGMHISAERTAFFFEASTFGYSTYQSFACSEPSPFKRRAFCDGPHIFFPANIADVRYGEQKKREARQAGEKEQMLPPDKHLSLQNGAENGSEYPESQQSPLTAVSNELELEQVLEALGRSGARLVVVAATDVRDRLFLFDKIRSVLPEALLVDLETDSLLAHPEFIHASRGALVLSSASVQPFEDLPANHPCDPIARAWASDAQKLLAHAVRDLDLNAEDKCQLQAADTPILHAVTRQGLKPLWSRRGRGAEGCAALLLALALWGGLLAVCAGVILLWSAAPWVIHSRIKQPLPPALEQCLKALLRADSDTYLLNTYLLSTLAVSVLVAFGNFPGWTVAFGVFIVFCWLLQGRLASYLRAVEGNGIRHVRWTCWRGKHGRRPCPSTSSGKHEDRPRPPTSPGKHADRPPPPTARKKRRLSTARRARWWSMSCSGVALILVSAALSQLLGWGGPSLRIDRDALAALGMSLNSGLAFHFSLALAVLVLIYCGAALRSVIESNSRNKGVVVAALRGAARGTAGDRLTQAYGGYLAGTWGFYAMGVVAAAFMVLSSTFDLDSVGGLFGLGRVTPFGPVATWAVFLAELMTTMVGIVWLVGAIHVGRRINLLTGFILRGMPDPKKPDPPKPMFPPRGLPKKESAAEPTARAAGSADGEESPASEFPGLWKEFDPAVPVSFPSTAMATGVMEGGKDVSDFFKRSRMIEWKQRLREVFSGDEDTTPRRHAILALLSTEIVQFRWAGFNALVCAFAGVGQVYLFPVFRGDSFLLFNLAMIFIVGLVIALSAVMFESNPVLSNIVCNTSSKGKLSRSLVGIMAQPFVLLLIATALSNVPGVRDWSDGALQPLLKLFSGNGGGGGE